MSNPLAKVKGLFRKCIEKLQSDEGHIKADGDWMGVKEYRDKYLNKAPCDGAQRMPCADDTTPAECNKCKGGRNL